MDNFYAPLPNAPPPMRREGVLSSFWNSILEVPLTIVITVLLAPLLIIIATRLLSGHLPEKVSKDGRTVLMLPYWVPIFGHGLSFIRDPVNLMSRARDQSPYGIFALNLGMSTHNIISHPTMVEGVMKQNEASLQFRSVAWSRAQRLFGVPKSNMVKQSEFGEELDSLSGYLMKEPYVGKMLKSTVQSLEQNIPQMISFMESPIDQQPWECWAKVTLVSPYETTVNLMALMRDMIGHASVPALFGRAFMEKNPDILHDIYEMDTGRIYFLMGLPPWTPWPSVTKAYLARDRVFQSLDGHQRALDALVDGNLADSAWDGLDDVSEYIMARHALFKKNGFKVKERTDITVLWAMIVNASLLVYWQIIYILATPGLADRIRAEIAPYAAVHKPESIGAFSEAPKLALSYEGLSKSCPLLKSTYFEALRLSSKPTSTRKVATDVTVSGDKQAIGTSTFILRKGEYVTIPHYLHMRDANYFKEPDKFIPHRFLVTDQDGSSTADIGTILPYGAGSSMCKGTQFAECECLAFVAGILTFWDIQPADKKAGWLIPRQKLTRAVSLPAVDMRALIKRRRFDWED